jgi:RNA polymerase sigma factor (sigma-70 family)
MVERLHYSAVLGAIVGPAQERSTEATPRTTPDAAAEVFDLVYRQMRKLAGRRDVDELAQVAAEQVLRGLPTFEGRSALSTWTYRICYLTVRKHDRWYRRWLRRFTLTDDGRVPDAPAEREPAGDDRLERDERARRLLVALDTLSAKRRAVVVLHDLEGHSVAETAALVGAEPRAVRSRLRDGRKALASALADDPYFGVEACRGKAPR